MFGINKVLLVYITFLCFWGTSAQTSKCAYGERGSLTATCENASIRFFRTTSYRFDMLDETLRCINCNLDVVEGQSFDISGNQIQNLDLRSSRITRLKPLSFVGLVFLKKLYLQNNSIEELLAETFKGIKKVVTLDISNNRISRIAANAFKELSNLTTLNLENNQIESMEANSLVGLNDLISLNVAHNKLQHVANFSNLNKLTTLNLANNKIDTVNMGDFGNMTALVTLNLANNLLGIVRAANFHTLKQIINLDLSFNMIKTLEPSAFENLKRLEILKLDNNKITEIKKGVFFDLVNLVELQLNNNLLTIFKTGLFTGLPEMSYLNISNNKLMLVMGTGNMALSNLHTLDLSRNNLTDLNYKLIYRHMPRLYFLALDHNPWACYLVTEIDEFFKDDNVKLSVDGILSNTSCVEKRKHEVEAKTYKLLAEEEHIDTSYAHSYIVYPLMCLMFLILAALGFIVYRLMRNSSMNLPSMRTTSHANLVSSDLLANESNY